MTTTTYARQFRGPAVASSIALLLLSCLINISNAFFQQPHRTQKRTQHHTSSLCISSTADQINHATLANKDLDRPTAQQIVNNILCPPNEERSRNKAGTEAFGQDRNSKVITNDDPRNEYTYGEFPFDSFDLLVDLAAGHLDEIAPTQKKKMIDVGSGCGRLALYAGLTRSEWDVTGIEIGQQLHSLAVGSLQRGIKEDWFRTTGDTASADESEISFYNGNVLHTTEETNPYFQNPQSDNDTVQSVLSQANLLFAYSTAWETDSAQSFNPELGAMVLSSKWSETLAATCQNGVVAVTTDRVLNPDHGWKLLDRMDVDNPSVWGSVGYISVLQK